MSKQRKFSYGHLTDKQKAVALDGLVEAGDVTRAQAAQSFQVAYEAAVERSIKTVSDEFDLDVEEVSPVRTAGRPKSGGANVARVAKDEGANGQGDASTPATADIFNRPVGRKARSAQPTLTPERLASRKLQGAYLGRIRQVPEGDERKQFKAIAAKKGREAAIKAIDKFLKAHGKG